ncbi:MAG TPA: RNA polymerase sigma factor [Pyrinomonadaceae bacterium]|jgi:RNA polymerase sigma-70 factor (ECF subfamily)|nr:RNA polymerase sigma factor [Pyrinomonadaceae bacterium]
MTDEAKRERESWWVLRAQSGDREALDELLKAVEEPLSRYIYSLVGERSPTEDILQEVFMRIYRKLRWLREPALFRAWAYRIASRETFRHLRGERQWQEQVRDEEALKSLPAAPPAREEFAPELRAELQLRVAGLPAASRAVIVLHYLHEMSLEEVAAVLEIPPGTVKSRLSYGLASLRRQFAEAHSQGGRG